MRDRLIALLEHADLAIGSCAGVVDPARLEPLIESVRAVRTRLAYPEDTLVVALAGGTGSGKSSLLNALTGSDMVDVGGVRPTTTHPAGAVPAALGQAVDPYLELIGVSERHHYEDDSGLVLIDLPDTDSVAAEHRHRVDQILPLVDVVVWVADPEKYRDARLHHDYLQPLAAYEGQFVFVLNQVDRLGAAEAGTVADDFRRALGEDGLVDPEVLAVAAAPQVGPPMGLERLRTALAAMSADRSTLYDKLLVDLATTARRLEESAGVAVDFDRRAADALDEAVDHLVRRDVPAATSVLTDFLDPIAVEAGGETQVRLSRLTGDVPQHLQRIADQTRVERAGWLRRRRVEPAPDREEVRRLLTEAVVRPARAVLARRAVALATIAEMAVEVESMRNSSSL
jgi:50S ribosome-binding GTPase